MIVQNDFSTLIDADDAYHWIHDFDRLFAITMICFHQQLHYLCGDAIAKGNGIEIFNLIMKSMNGQLVKDADRARKLLYENFRLNVKLPLPAELESLDGLIIEYEWAQGQDLTNAMKMNCQTAHHKYSCLMYSIRFS
jgi:hypothetical protein